jgi:hypothetical protein
MNTLPSGQHRWLPAITQEGQSGQRLSQADLPQMNRRLAQNHSAHGVNVTVQARFVTCGFVGMNNPAVRHAVDDRRTGVVRCGCCVAVAGFDGGQNSLDVGAHHRALTLVGLAMLFSLAGAFLCLCCICHYFGPSCLRTESRAFSLQMSCKSIG